MYIHGGSINKPGAKEVVMRSFVHFKLLALVTLGLSSCSAEYGDRELPVGSMVAPLMAANSGVGYADIDTPEALPWGPSGI